jgi:hypothetical protein
MKPLNLDRYRKALTGLRPGLAFAGTLLLCPALMADEPVIPQGYEASRYAPMWKRSPFTLATPAAEAEASKAGFAQALTLNGLLAVGGVNYAVVTDASGGGAERLLIGPQALASQNNIRLVDVKVEEEGKIRTVTLAKGSETAKLQLVLQDSSLAAATTPGAIPNGNPFNSGQPRMPVINPNTNPQNGSPDVVAPAIRRRRPNIIVPTSPQ